MSDLFGLVRLLSDGESTFMQLPPFPDVPVVQCKDAVYDATRGLKVRVHRPSSSAGKLPVLVHFHGGVGSYDMPGGGHHLLQRLAADLPAVVLSVQADWMVKPVSVKFKIRIYGN